MADLLDIAPAAAVGVVKIDGKRIIVRGLSGNAVASLAARFPDLIRALLGGGGNIGPRLIEQIGAALGPVIAAGCGHLGDEQYEQVAGALLIEDQVKFLKPIIELTFPNGVAPFVTAMAALVPGAGEGAKPVKIRSRKSPSPSLSSSGAASLPTLQ